MKNPYAEALVGTLGDFLSIYVHRFNPHYRKAETLHLNCVKDELFACEFYSRGSLVQLSLEEAMTYFRSPAHLLIVTAFIAGDDHE